MRLLFCFIRSLRALCLAAALCITACSLIPDQSSLRADEVEQALLPVANVALETGQLETAKRLYRRLLDVDQESHVARMGLGDVAFQDRRPDDAARWYLSAQANAKTPQQRNDALLWHGRAALDAGQLATARRSFERLAAADEDAPALSVAWALNGIGLTLLLEGDLQGAVTVMERAVRRAPGEQMFADNLARALAMLAELRAGEDADRAATAHATTPPPQHASRPPSTDPVEPEPQPRTPGTPASIAAPAMPEVAHEPQPTEQDPLESQLRPTESDTQPVGLPEPNAGEPEALESGVPEPERPHWNYPHPTRSNPSPTQPSRSSKPQPSTARHLIAWTTYGGPVSRRATRYEPKQACSCKWAPSQTAQPRKPWPTCC